MPFAHRMLLLTGVTLALLPVLGGVALAGGPGADFMVSVVAQL